MRKPSITTSCPANKFSDKDERIAEFSCDGIGGLVAVRRLPEGAPLGSVRVDVYRVDPGVFVSSPELDAAAKVIRGLLAAYGNCGTPTQQAAADAASDLLRRYGFSTDPLPGDHPSGLGYLSAADFE